MINVWEIKGDVPHLLSFTNCFRAGDNRWLGLSMYIFNVPDRNAACS